MTPDEAAEYTNLSKAFILQLARTGKLDSARPTKRTIRFRRDWLDAYLESQKEQ